MTRKLERIEAAKAKERQGLRTDLTSCTNLQNVNTRDMVAEKLGIGSGETYRKEKYIADNRDQLAPEDFADWDEGGLSTNKAYQRIKCMKQSLCNGFVDAGRENLVQLI